ncbi:MAG TPA: peptidylprolyl isomerase [Polyangiaceae bacterium]|nr:peptidylprolyl isomerase [Polyangiaceae bacterium]
MPKARKAPQSKRTRYIALSAAGVVAVVGLYLTFREKPADTHKTTSNDAQDSAADARAVTTGDLLADSLDAGDPFDPLENIGNGSGEPLDSGFGLLLPDGAAVPALPEKAPRSVRFGVVLVSYAGAEGAPPNARSKKDARELAEKLAAEAKTDFHAAVGHGDTGSADDLGRIPRGTLERAPEYVLFTLAAGQTSDPIDTPRGFWIVKRTE